MTMKFQVSQTYLQVIGYLILVCIKSSASSGVTVSFTFSSGNGNKYNVTKIFSAF